MLISVYWFTLVYIDITRQVRLYWRGGGHTVWSEHLKNPKRYLMYWNQSSRWKFHTRSRWRAYVKVKVPQIDLAMIGGIVLHKYILLSSIFCSCSIMSSGFFFIHLGLVWLVRKNLILKKIVDFHLCRCIISFIYQYFHLLWIWNAICRNSSYGNYSMITIPDFVCVWYL